jgi:DNA-binding transcriptional LysR family regulator
MARKLAKKRSVSRAQVAEPVAPRDADATQLDLRQVRHFLAVVEHGNFGRAAQHLALSKQGLSQSISALEEALGVRLFERGQFGAVPTEFGRALTQHAKVILAEARKAREEIDGLRVQHRGSITFALGSSFSEHVAPLAIRRFQAAHPQVVLKIANVHPDNMLALLSAGELDFVAMGELRDVDVSNLERTPLFRMSSQLLIPASNPLARRRSIDLADLVDQTFVGVWRDDLTERTMASAFRSRGLPLPTVIDSDNFLVTRGLVLDQGCLVIANRLFFDRELADGSLIEHEIPGLSYSVTYVLYRRRDTVVGRATLALVDEIRRAASERFSTHFVPLSR